MGKKESGKAKTEWLYDGRRDEPNRKEEKKRKQYTARRSYTYATIERESKMYETAKEDREEEMENLPGSSSSSAQSICPLHSANGNIVHCNAIQMARAVADNRTKVNDSLKSIVNGSNDGNSNP